MDPSRSTATFAGPLTGAGFRRAIGPRCFSFRRDRGEWRALLGLRRTFRRWSRPGRPWFVCRVLALLLADGVRRVRSSSGEQVRDRRSCGGPLAPGTLSVPRIVRGPFAPGPWASAPSTPWLVEQPRWSARKIPARFAQPVFLESPCFHRGALTAPGCAGGPAQPPTESRLVRAGSPQLESGTGGAVRPIRARRRPGHGGVGAWCSAR